MKQNKTQNVLTTAFGKAKLSASVLMLMGASLLMNPAQAVELIHLMVGESGMQRVTYDDLAQQGHARRLQLVHDLVGVDEPLRDRLDLGELGRRHADRLGLGDGDVPRKEWGRNQQG